MTKVLKILRQPIIRQIVLIALMAIVCTNAYADLESGLESLQDKVRTISVPLATVFLIIAGWQKMAGRGDLFVAALIGSIIIFAAPQIIDMFQRIFGK